LPFERVRAIVQKLYHPAFYETVANIVICAFVHQGRRKSGGFVIIIVKRMNFRDVEHMNAVAVWELGNATGALDVYAMIGVAGFSGVVSD
jgi:hypothetical protein